MEGHHVNVKTAEATPFLFTLGPHLTPRRPSNIRSVERNGKVKIKARRWGGNDVAINSFLQR